MSESIVLGTYEMDCPICSKDHVVEMRKRQTSTAIKNISVNYEEVYYLCPNCNDEENEFVSAKMMDENLLRARDAYRQKMDLLTSQDIVRIRTGYGMTQNDFAVMLGLGEVTISRYETKAIQDRPYDQIIRKVYEDPMYAIELIDKNKSRFSAVRYEKIRKNIAENVDERGNLYLLKQRIRSLYVHYEEENELNGYRILDIDKVSSAIGYFAQYIGYLYKVKLMKLLWYTDALSYARHNRSMMGLVYLHMPFGALPIAHGEILYLPTVRVEEEINHDDNCSYRILPNDDVRISSFTVDELRILEYVATKFDDYKAKDIIQYMHEERAYKETLPNQVIPYTFAKHLNELR